MAHKLPALAGILRSKRSPSHNFPLFLGPRFEAGAIKAIRLRKHCDERVADAALGDFRRRAFKHGSIGEHRAQLPRNQTYKQRWSGPVENHLLADEALQIEQRLNDR